MPTTAQYAAANKAAGENNAAYELRTRLYQAGIAPEYLEVIDAYCAETDASMALAYEPIYRHLENLPDASLAFDEPAAPYVVACVVAAPSTQAAA